MGIRTNHRRLDYRCQNREIDRIRIYVTDIANGDFIKVRGVDFWDNPVSSFTASVAGGSNGGSIKMHLDNDRLTAGFLQGRMEQTAVKVNSRQGCQRDA